MGDRWGREGPPAEAYSRLTDVERFRPLHDVAEALMVEMEQRFDIARTTATTPDPYDGSLATVLRLEPAHARASALEVVLTSFPGLLLRFGREGGARVPTCGCDACDETLEDCVEELRRYVDAVVAGSFGERLVQVDGWGHERWYNVPGAGWSGTTPVRGAELKALRAVLPEGELTWAPWPHR